MTRTIDPDLVAMAEDELARALTLGWRDLAKVTPWGDSFEGLSPAGREVEVERNYLWADGEGGDILCEVSVTSTVIRREPAAAVSKLIRRPRS